MKCHIVYVWSRKKFKVRKNFIRSNWIWDIGGHIYGKAFVVCQTKNTGQRYLFVVRQTKKARQRGKIISTALLLTIAAGANKRMMRKNSLSCVKKSTTNYCVCRTFFLCRAPYRKRTANYCVCRAFFLCHAPCWKRTAKELFVMRLIFCARQRF
jgi:hypothetical protein